MALIHSDTRNSPGSSASTEHWQPNPVRPDASAVSWGAILAGAVAAAALSLILLMLGVGLGLSSVSPWSGRGASAQALGASTILWLILTQLLSCAMGGYLAGRLRSRWLAVHTDEVYFRDTAHGFLAWGIASLVTAALLTGTIASILGVGVQAGATVAAANLATPLRADSQKPGSDAPDGAYFIERLFRGNAAPVSAPLAEVARIFSQALPSGPLPAEDLRYVGQLVARATSLAQPEAEKRVSDGFAQLQGQLQGTQARAKEAIDKARVGSAHAALWLFISLLIGAFVASWAATWGGRGRDAQAPANPRIQPL